MCSLGLWPYSVASSPSFRLQSSFRIVVLVFRIWNFHSGWAWLRSALQWQFSYKRRLAKQQIGAIMDFALLVIVLICVVLGSVSVNDQPKRYSDVNNSRSSVLLGIGTALLFAGGLATAFS